jgi:hypothetical protein
MKPAHALGVMLAAATLGACHDDGWPTCPVSAGTQGDYRVVAKDFDAASYFPPGLYSSLPTWKIDEIVFGKSTTPEKRDPYRNELFQTASFLRELGEESLYARRAEPDLHVYRVFTLTAFGGHWIRRAEQRGPEAWVESRVHHRCWRRGDNVGSYVAMSQKEFPIATWQAIDSCMEQHFWTVAMEEVMPPTPAKPDPDGDVAPVTLMCDGPDESLIEGLRGGEYHAIRRTREDTAGASTRDPLLACARMLESAAR